MDKDIACRYPLYIFNSVRALLVAHKMEPPLRLADTDWWILLQHRVRGDVGHQPVPDANLVAQPEGVRQRLGGGPTQVN